MVIKGAHWGPSSKAKGKIPPEMHKKRGGSRYDWKRLLEDAIKDAEENKLVFKEDLEPYLPCHKKTFWEVYPPHSEGWERIIKVLEKNKRDLKVHVRKKWANSDNPTSLVMLYRLVCTPEERNMLNPNYIDLNNRNSTVTEVRIITSRRDDD